MKFQIVKGSTSVILTVFIQDSSSTTGAGLGSLIETSSITGGYVKRNGLGVALTVDENVTTEGTYEAPTTAGQVRIGTPANMPTGFYEFHFHNDLFTTADWVTMGFTGATDMATLTLEIQLTSFDLNTTSPAVTLTSAERDSIAAALLDLANGVETGVTLRQSERLKLSSLVGKLSGATTTTVSIRDTGDAKNRIVATVDANGNRTAVTLDAT